MAGKMMAWGEQAAGEGKMGSGGACGRGQRVKGEVGKGGERMGRCGMGDWLGRAAGQASCADTTQSPAYRPGCRPRVHPTPPSHRTT